MLHNKVIYITGGTSGIGEATVYKVLEYGAKVFFIGRRKAEGQRVVQTAIGQGYSPDAITFFPADVTSPQEQKAAIDYCIQIFGRLDGVFANAGKHMVGTILETTLEQRQEMFRVDVEGVYLTLHYTIPYMQRFGGGSIVLTGSDQSLIGKAKSSAYGAAKGAIGQLTKSTAIDFAADNIRVNAICPGTIDTPLARGAMDGFARANFDGDINKALAFLSEAQPIRRLGTAEEVAELVCFLLSDKAKFMTGSLVSIDGGYTAQ